MTRDETYALLAAERNLYYDGKRLPYNPDLTPHARDLRQHATKEERLLWKQLRTLPFRVLRQRPIDNYIVDFYVREKNAVIEIDGGQHYTEIGKNYDSARTAALESYGLSVYRFSNREVRENIEGVCLQLWKELKV